jgi:hypothetical protein
VIADVVSYAIAGIGFINAVGHSFVRKGQHEHCHDARLPQKFRTSGASFRTFHRLPPTSHEIHSARARVEGVMRFRLLPRPDCQGVKAPPATPHIRGLEVHDSRHLTSCVTGGEHER